MRRGAILAVAAIALTIVATALGRGQTGTKVTITSAERTITEDVWAGRVFSDRRACKDGRRVVVFRARPGDDVRIGATRAQQGESDPGYFWIYGQEEREPSGRYYAKAPATDQCQGDRSTTIQSNW